MRRIPFFILFILSLLRLSVNLKAQGREFWFAPPEVTDRHGDGPVQIRISTYDKPANVTISMPAAGNRVLVNQSVPANTLKSFQLDKELLETKPADAVLNTGIVIRSDEDISTYYEVEGISVSRGAHDNAEIFVLKGNNALGTQFYVPMQTTYNNQSAGNLNAWSSFDIVATQNNTRITIVPSRALLNHPAGIPFTIVLNEGQTYSARALSILGTQHPAGSEVISDKPIAVTYKDDSIFKTNPLSGTVNWDLIGDQILPVTELGTEYIVLQNSSIAPPSRGDFFYITAIQNNTVVTIGDKTDTLSKGQTKEYDIPLGIKSVFVKTSSPVSLLHVSGFYGELACANIPPVKCTGARSHLFIKTNLEEFRINLLVKTGGEGNFKLNGSNRLIPASAFQDVTYSGGLWKFGQFSFNNSEIPSGENRTDSITNSTHNFHMAVLNGDDDFTMRYGYYAGFGYLNLGPDKKLCAQGTLTIDAGANKDSYSWSNGSTSRSITISDTGKYYVTTTKEGSCIFTDSINIGLNPVNTQPILGKDTSSCSNSPVKIKALSNFKSYKWQDNSNNSEITTAATGTYILTVTDSTNCTRSDTVFYKSLPLPVPEIISPFPDEITCADSSIILQLDRDFKQIKWFTGETTLKITSKRNSTDLYTVSVENEFGCTGKDTLLVDCTPYISIPNVFTPNGDNYNETFRIKNLKPGIFSLKVLNRWGNEVFQTDNYDNSWNGNESPDGIYFYSLENRNTGKNHRGTIQLLR